MHTYHHKKRFGQHFLVDESVLQQIADAIHPHSHDHMIEIGPGQGVLTEILLHHVNKLEVVEIDRDLVSLLEKKFSNKIHIHSCDALQFDFSSVKKTQKIRVVGNLPYNISTPLLFHCFDQLDHIHDMHFLLQKEVVERLTADVGNHNYGRLSIMTQYFCDCELLFVVNADAFDPPPKVQSALVRLQPKIQNTVARNIQHLSKLVQEAFNYRRKTLRNGLKHRVSDAALESLGINPQARPQELSVDNYVRLSNFLEPQ